MTTISRDRIQFEDRANEIGDGNGQMHRDACARIWESTATDYLESHGGGEARVRLDRDTVRFAVTGDKTVAADADSAGWDAVQDYVDEQTARLSQ